MSDPSVIVVGAGMAGLTAARTLMDHGVAVTVLDKGRAVGGRMATKRHEGARYDHGAQRFRASSEEFARMVDDWRSHGVVRTWYEEHRTVRGERQTLERLIGANGMRGIPEHMAVGVDVRTGVTVRELNANSGTVTAVTDEERFTATAAIVTAPLPQLLDLVDLSGDAELESSCRAIRYNASLALLAQPRDTRAVGSGRLEPDSGAIAWLADNQHKGVSGVPAVTVHSTPGFAAVHLESEPADWVPMLLSEAEELLGSELTAPLGHRWRYAEPQTTLGSSYAVLSGPTPIVLAGEAFVSARVEGAFLSGLAAGRALADLLV